MFLINVGTFTNDAGGGATLYTKRCIGGEWSQIYFHQSMMIHRKTAKDHGAQEGKAGEGDFPFMNTIITVCLFVYVITPWWWWA